MPQQYRYQYGDDKYWRQRRKKELTMASYNPCCFWTLKDGCMIIGIWSLSWAILQLGVFSWQTAVIKFYRDRMENRRVPAYQSYSVYDNRLGGGDWSEIYITPEEKVFMALFVIQILSLVCAFALLFASMSLLFGIHASSKFLVWPWFPCMIASVICSLTYCIIWWIGSVNGYHIALTVLEFLSVVINIYCMFCIFTQYRRIVRGYSRRKKDIPKQIIYEYKTEDHTHVEPYSKMKNHTPEKEAYFNEMYEHEPPPATKVAVFETGAADQQRYDRRYLNSAYLI